MILRDVLIRWRSPWRMFGAFAVAGLLAACVTPNALLRAQEQMDLRQWESALESYRQATRDEPNNVDYRTAYLRAQERAINAMLAEAAPLRESQPAQATEIYQRILQIAPNQDRALAGLQALGKAKRHQRMQEDASRAAATGRDQEARAKYKKLLDEVPDHAGAREALLALDEKAGRTGARAALDASLRKPVSLEFRDATLKVVFDALSRSTSINFVFDRDLKQDTRISVMLRNVAFDDALHQITSSNGLASRVVNPNTLLVYPSLPQKLKEYQDLLVRNFFVANADVKQLSAMLKAVLKVKDLYTDEKRNLIVLRDTPEVVAMAEKMIAAHDQPEPEVMLEVEILEYNHTVDSNLGIKLPEQVSFGIASPVTLESLRAVNDASINVKGLDTLLTLNLKRQNGDINLLANPRIRVRNREKAKFHIGDRVPVITSTTYPGVNTGVTSSAVNYLDVGIKLEFEPSIQLDDDVVIKTVLEVSSITNTVVNAGTTAYQVGTRNATTTLTLRDGETQVLAGLLSSDESATTDRLPGLGDIPVLGRLFSNKASKGGRKEILLSITPRIVRNLQRPTSDLLEINFGPEAGNQGSGGVSVAQPAQQPVPQPVQQIRPGVSTQPQQPVQTAPPSSGLVPMQSMTSPVFGNPATQTPTPTPSAPVVQPAPMQDFEPPPGVGRPSR